MAQRVAKSTLSIALLISLGGCEVVASFDRDKIPTTTTRPPGPLPEVPFEPVPNVPDDGGPDQLDASLEDAATPADASSDAALDGGLDAGDASDAGDAGAEGDAGDAAVDADAAADGGDAG